MEMCTAFGAGPATVAACCEALATAPITLECAGQIDEGEHILNDTYKRSPPTRSDWGSWESAQPRRLVENP